MNAWRGGAMMIVVAMAVVNVVHIAQRVPPRDSSGTAIDPVIRHERRFAALYRSVGVRGLKGTIGYIDDLSGSGLTEDARGVEDYYLTQFALVPLVLDPSPEPHEWAVANLRTTIPQTRVLASWRIVEDFGAGVLLLRKAER